VLNDVTRLAESLKTSAAILWPMFPMKSKHRLPRSRDLWRPCNDGAAKVAGGCPSAFLSIVQKHVDRLEAIVEDLLLSLSRIEREGGDGKISPSKSIAASARCSLRRRPGLRSQGIGQEHPPGAVLPGGHKGENQSRPFGTGRGEPDRQRRQVQRAGKTRSHRGARKEEAAVWRFACKTRDAASKRSIWIGSLNGSIGWTTVGAENWEAPG
jgi:hypothetical protein